MSRLLNVKESGGSEALPPDYPPDARGGGLRPAETLYHQCTPAVYSVHVKIYVFFVSKIKLCKITSMHLLNLITSMQLSILKNKKRCRKCKLQSPTPPWVRPSRAAPPWMRPSRTMTPCWCHTMAAPCARAQKGFWRITPSAGELGSWPSLQTGTCGSRSRCG